LSGAHPRREGRLGGSDAARDDAACDSRRTDATEDLCREKDQASQCWEVSGDDQTERDGWIEPWENK